MTNPAEAVRATARELAIVFLVVLLTAFITSRVRSTALAVAPEAVRSLLVIASLGTVAFGCIRAAGGRWPAWLMTGFTVVTLVCGCAAAIAGKLIEPVGPQPVLFAVEAPARKAQVADLFADRPQTWTILGPSFTIRADRHIVIDGQAATAFSYLAFSKPQHFDADSLLVVEGVLQSGGFTLGLWQVDAWVTYTSIVDPGAFRSWVVVPRDGDYQLAIANASRRNLPTRAEFSSLRLRQ